LIDNAARTFAAARATGDARLAAGDISGYAARRIRLEAARYAALRADAMLTRETARLALASLLAGGEPTGGLLRAAAMRPLEDLTVLAASISVPATPLDSLIQAAVRERVEVRIAGLETRAAKTDARVMALERRPVPAVTAGFKRENVIGAAGGTLTQNGFVLGLSLPLPVWDGRVAAVEAADAVTRQREAESAALVHLVAREVADAAAAVRAVDEQITLLTPLLGADAQTAISAAQAAYTNGEIPLVEWLDAVRAYQEAEATWATLLAEQITRRAALSRAAGLPVVR
jgi:cobalt-zinc-cadmium efflux system outer membrane protein